MEIEFDLTIEDIIEFNLVSVDNSPSIGHQLFLQRLVFSIIVFAAIPLGIYVVGGRHLQVTDYIVGAVLGGFVFFVHPSVNRFDYIRRLRKFYTEGDVNLPNLVPIESRKIRHVGLRTDGASNLAMPHVGGLCCIRTASVL